MRALAAVVRRPDGPYRLEEVELDPPGEGEVLVRVVAAGLCHTDVLAREDGVAPLPVVPGHEGAGVVEAVGPGVVGAAPGDHVVLTFDSCGACRGCRVGAPAHCDTFIERNLTGRRVDGSTGARDASGGEVSSRWFGQSSFATHAVATARNVVVVDPSLPLELLAPLGCSVQTGAGSVLLVLGVEAGTSVVVFGAGAVGLVAVMAAAAVGAEPIVAVDRHPARLELAAGFGAHHVLAAGSGGGPDGLAEVVEAVCDLTGGGADRTLDTTGVPAVVEAALAALRPGGTCGMVGAQQGPVVLDELALVGRTAVGILEGGADPTRFLPELIRMWQAGSLPFDRLVRHYPLAEVARAEADARAGEVVKPVLLPGG